MYKTPPQNKSAASTEDFNKGTEKPVPTGGKDKGSTSSVRKSIGELESRLGAAPKNIIATLPMKQNTKIPTANEGDDNQLDRETTQYSNRAQEAKAHLVRIKLLLNSSRNLKNEIKDGIIEAADKLYGMTKNMEQGKGQSIEKEKSGIGNCHELFHELIRKLEQHSEFLTECRTETQRLSEEVKKHREEAHHLRKCYSNQKAAPGVHLDRS
ncbi:unnamed protein product [Parnassius apollo]|uniref:(apollo) hypothetical protein n=1 Tax=Parnassius apollo TaxID=110799 RepID=A0A8S3XLP9_PARAO|nr:unnamed protein product [Parnassius apollo]